MEWGGTHSVCLLTHKAMGDQRNFGKLSLETLGLGDCDRHRIERGKKGKESPEFWGRLILVTMGDRLGQEAPDLFFCCPTAPPSFDLFPTARHRKLRHCSWSCAQCPGLPPTGQPGWLECVGWSSVGEEITIQFPAPFRLHN